MKRKWTAMLLTVVLLAVWCVPAPAARAARAAAPLVRLRALDLTQTKVEYQDRNGAWKTGDPANSITDSGEGWSWQPETGYDDNLDVSESNNSGVCTLSGANIRAEDKKWEDSVGLTLPAGAILRLAEGTQSFVAGGTAGVNSVGIFVKGFWVKGFWVKGGILLQGEGRLIAMSGKGDVDSIGIYLDAGDLTIQSGTVTAISGEGGTHSFGINLDFDTIVQGGAVTAIGGRADHSAGIRTHGCTVEGGVVTAAGAAAGESFGIDIRFSPVNLNGGLILASAGTGMRYNGAVNSGLQFGPNMADLLDPENDESYTKSFAVYGDKDIYHVQTDALDFTNPDISASGDGYEWDNSTSTLTLENLILVPGADTESPLVLPDGAALKLTGNNVVRGFDRAGNSCGVFCAGSLTVRESGSGALYALGGKITAEDGGSMGMYIDGDLTVESSALTALGGSAAAGVSNGIHTTGSLVLGGGTVTAVGGPAEKDSSVGIESQAAFTVENGVVAAIGGPAFNYSIGISASGFAATGGALTASGHTGAVNYAPTLQGKAAVLLASENAVGASPIAYDPQNLASYRYLRMGEKPAPPSPSAPTYTLAASAGKGGTVEPAGEISVASGGEQEFTFTAEDGYWLAAVLVDGKALRPEGKSFTLSGVKDNHSLRGVFLPFTDVQPGDWFAPDVAALYDRNILLGATEKTFAPQQKLTREMLVTMLYRAQAELRSAEVPELPENLGYPFEDVDANAYYANAVYWAREAGVVFGMSTETFGVGQNITRQDLACMLYRYAAYLERDTAGRGDLSAFTDGGQISEYAQDAVSWAVNSGILTGKGSGILDPRGSATRAEAAAMLNRFLALL